MSSEPIALQVWPQALDCSPLTGRRPRSSERDRGFRPTVPENRWGMISRYAFFAMLLVASFVPLLPRAEGQSTSTLIYVQSDSASHAVLRERLERCLQLLLQNRKLGIDSSPVILVVQVSAGEAARAGLAGVAVKLRLNTGADGEPYYELWLAGEPTAFQYTSGIDAVLTDHFGRHEKDSEQKRTIARVVR